MDAKFSKTSSVCDMSMDRMHVFSLAVALEEILEIFLHLIWTQIPAALYAAGWSDEVLGQMGPSSPICCFESSDLIQ